MILRTCVVIYAHDDSRAISEVVNGVLKHCPFPVRILDDGSETPVSNVLYSWDVRNALEAKRVRVDRSDQHLGKGKALQSVVQTLVAEGFTHMLTLDANGRSLPTEIGKLIAAAVEHPWDLILGKRKQTAPVPKAAGSSWKAKLSGFWMRYQTGMAITDPSSGFRIYPLMAMQTLSFMTRQHEFDIEALIRLQWDGTGVREVEIEHRGEAPTAQRPAKTKYIDGLRTSTLNAVLAVVSLFKTHRSPRELSTALAMGVFVGCTPFFGFHTFIIMALAVLLRLNMVVMWIGTHVSTPILAPFVVMIEIWVGKHWLNVAAEPGRHGEFYQWLAGSVVLGVTLGAVTMAVTYFAAWSVQKRKTNVPWGDGQPSWTLRFLARNFSQAMASRLVWIGMPYLYLCRLSARRGLSEFYKTIAPEMKFRARQARILRHLHGFAIVRMDRERKPNIPPAPGRMLSAHVGALDLTVAGKAGMVDRVTGPQLELLPLFGKLIAVNVGIFQPGPSTFAFGIKEGGEYKLLAKNVRIDEARLQWAAEFVAQMEAVARAHPEQWYNFFPIWSSLPRLEPVRAILWEDVHASVLAPLNGPGVTPAG